jgi:peptide/nickel transport system substrate-binding protein
MKNIASKSIAKSIFLCLIIIMVIWGCNEQTSISTPTVTVTGKAETPQYGGILREATNSKAQDMGYPGKLVGTASIYLAAPAIETLLHYDDTGKLIPWLATEVKSDAVNKTLTIALRKEVKFHDGTDFNAESVKWNLEQCQANKVNGSAKFKSIDIVDDYAIRINLTEWDSIIESAFAMQLGMIISPTACKKNGIEWAANNPVGTGPFQFVSWQKEVSIKYKKFDGYWQKGKPYLDGIEIIFIADPTVCELSFRRGEADILSKMPSKTVIDLEKDGFIVKRMNAGSGAWSLVFDSANVNSIFSNVKVRQAISHAIDNKTIIKQILLGQAAYLNQLIYENHWGYNKSVTGYPFDPMKAKQALVEAGYPNGFKTKITYWTDPERDAVLVTIQNYLKAVNINIELVPLQMLGISQITNGGKWDGILLASASGDPDVVGYLSQRYVGSSKYLSNMLAPADYLNVVDSAITAGDFQTKQKWAQEAQKLLIDKYCLVTPIWGFIDNSIRYRYVHNLGVMEFANTAQWTPEDTWLEKNK